MFYWVSDADRVRLRAVLDLADDDDWRRRLRKRLAVYDSAKREEVLTAPEAQDQPPILVAALAGLLIRGPQGEAAQALLQQAQQRHPDDFWINFQLGYLLQEERPREAAGYLRAAVASRPESSQALILLGRALHDAGDPDGAATAFRAAIRLNPNRTGARDLARVLAPRGRLEEARVAWEKTLEGGPDDHDPWYGYAQLCAFLGQEEAYRRARKPCSTASEIPLPTGPSPSATAWPACSCLPRGRNSGARSRWRTGPWPRGPNPLTLTMPTSSL